MGISAMPIGQTPGVFPIPASTSTLRGTTLISTSKRKPDIFHIEAFCEDGVEAVTTERIRGEVCIKTVRIPWGKMGSYIIVGP